MKVCALVVLFTCCSFAQSLPSETPTAEASIATDDVLDILVFREPDLSRTARVGSTGLITLPVIGRLNAAGLTTDDLAAKIKQLLEKSLMDPDVTVSIKEFGTSVSVIGAVRSPGAYPLRGSISLLNLLAKAGSILESADDTIQIIRKSAPPGAPVLTVSTEDLFRSGKTDLNISIFPGDVVNVVPRPAATVVTIVGEVAHPGEIPLKSAKGTTIRQALASGGWFTTNAKRRDAKIIRVQANGTKEEIPIDLSDIMSSSFEDQAMKPNDILYVPSNKLKQGFSRALDSAINITTARLIVFGH
jgi:polysaccharide export outer membrane protein